MYCTQAWGTISSDLNHRVLESAYLNDKKLYRRLVQDMAMNLRKRPKVVLEMPRTARHELFQPLLQLPQFEVLAQNLVIHWLSQEKREMVTGFLDHLKIPHDENGFAEDFPEDMPKGSLKKAVDRLLKEGPEEDVWFYLRIFDNLTGTEWKALEELLPEPEEPEE